MPRSANLRTTPVGDIDSFRPSRQRPVRVRSRAMPADTHFEPHSHAWSQLAYCASGILQVAAEQGAAAGDEITYIVPPSRAVWIAPGARHTIHVLEDAQFRTLYIDASVTPSGWTGCRVIVVSPLLRELIQALDGTPPPAKAREELLSELVLDEITPVSQVAASSGYASDSAFSAMFKAAMGHPPTRWGLQIDGRR